MHLATSLPLSFSNSEFDKSKVKHYKMKLLGYKNDANLISQYIFVQLKRSISQKQNRKKATESVEHVAISTWPAQKK